MSHDTFYICPHCEHIADLPDIQWTCCEHVITRARFNENPMPGRKYAINYQGSLLIVGKATESPRLPVGDPLNRNGGYAIIRNGYRQLDEYGALHGCPLCGAEVQVTLCQCEKCRKPVKPNQILTYDVQYAPTGLAAASLANQYDNPGPGRPRWIA
jgi:hypothetical protein